MPRLDAQYRLKQHLNSDFYTDESLSFTAKGIATVMSQRQSPRDGGTATTLRSLLNGKDDPEDLADALTELARAGVITEVNE